MVERKGEAFAFFRGDLWRASVPFIAPCTSIVYIWLCLCELLAVTGAHGARILRTHRTLRSELLLYLD